MESAPAEWLDICGTGGRELFFWTVIDPIYVLTSNLAIDPGYNEERAYALYMEYYDELHGKYDKTQDSTAIKQENLYRITRLVKNCPEVESFALVTSASFPNSSSWNGAEYFNDTLKVHSQYYQFVQTEGGRCIPYVWYEGCQERTDNVFARRLRCS